MENPAFWMGKLWKIQHFEWVNQRTKCAIFNTVKLSRPGHLRKKQDKWSSKSLRVANGHMDPKYRKWVWRLSDQQTGVYSHLVGQAIACGSFSLAWYLSTHQNKSHMTFDAVHLVNVWKLMWILNLLRFPFCSEGRRVSPACDWKGGGFTAKGC
jgi:hypothetical protein